MPIKNDNKEIAANAIVRIQKSRLHQFLSFSELLGFNERPKEPYVLNFLEKRILFCAILPNPIVVFFHGHCDNIIFLIFLHSSQLSFDIKDWIMDIKLNLLLNIIFLLMLVCSYITDVDKIVLEV